MGNIAFSRFFSAGCFHFSDDLMHRENQQHRSRHTQRTGYESAYQIQGNGYSERKNVRQKIQKREQTRAQKTVRHEPQTDSQRPEKLAAEEENQKNPAAVC